MNVKWIFLSILFQSSVVFAYRFTDDFNNGFYWEGGPVTFTVVESNSTRAQLLKSVIESAIDEWEDSLGQQLWEVSPTVLANVEGGRNIIRWSNDIEGETGFNRYSTLAVTLRYITGPYYTQTEILLNAQHPTLSNLQALKATLVHELGHTYGLDHSSVPQAIMYYSYGSQSLHNDDIDGMVALVDETRRRQAIGYISPLAFEEGKSSSQAISCGTIDTQSGNGGDGGGPFSVLFSLILGLIALSPFSIAKRKILPIKI